MSIVQSIGLGILQGLSEFLPVSSSGHLILARKLFGLSGIPILFDVILHVATLLVVLLVFRRRIAAIIIGLYRGIFRKELSVDDKTQIKLFWIVVIATFFTAGIGYAVSILDVGAHPKLVSALFLVTGVILLLSRFFRGSLDYSKIKAKQGIITGIAQGLGVFPGISRSGITISAALFSGMQREKAGEFAFLISIPAIVGALLLELKDAEALFAQVKIWSMLSGFLAAFIVGLISLLLLLRLLKRGNFHLFAIYLIPLGLLGLLLL